MSTDLPAEPAPEVTIEFAAVPSTRPAVQIKWIWGLVAAYWVFTFGMLQVDVTMLTRFGSRSLSWLVLVLGYLGWWFCNRRIAGRDRVFSLLLLIAATYLTLQISHPSMDLISLLFSAFPLTFTAWTAWLTLTQKQSYQKQRLGIAALTLFCIGGFCLMRLNGIDGLQRAEIHWRWTPSAEEQFLASRPYIATPEPSTTKESAENALPEWTLQTGDWPAFRGSQRNGVVTELAASAMSPEPKLVWRQRIGPGWSSVIVVDGFIVTQEQRGPHEAVTCYAAATGKEVWAHEEAVRFDEPVSGAGPRSTPTFHNGRIYATTARGKLLRLAASTGKLIWSHDLMAETQSAVPQWGYSCSPLVVDGVVIVHAGGKDDQGWLAYQEGSGDLVWKIAGGTQTYSSPQLVTLLGQQQVLLHDNKALVSVNAADGRVLWDVPNDNEYQVPMLQPRAINDHQVLVSFEPELALVDVQRSEGKWPAATRWKSNKLKAGFNDLVIHGNEIIGLDDGILASLDLQTGKRNWKRTRYGHGQLLDLGDQMIVMAESGEVALWDKNAERTAERSRFQAIQGKTWNHPVFAHGRLYVRNGEEFACYQLATD